MYNHKKMDKKAQFSWNLHTEKLLRENNDDHGQPIRDYTGITDYQFEESGGRKEVDNSEPYQSQMMRSGTNDGVTEKALNENPDMYNHKRHDKAWDSRVGVTERLDEAQWQKKMKDWNESQQKENFDTSFWDKYVGVQMQGEKTTITNNVQSSQLQNHYERFKDLDLQMPNNASYQDDLKVDEKEETFYQMVSASLKKADSLLFKINATAAYEDRSLTNNEKQMITDINSAKIRLLAAMDGKIDPNNAKSILTAQYEMSEGAYDLPYEGVVDSNEEDFNGEEESFTIEPDFGFDGEVDGYDVYEHGVYERSSVLAGQPRRTLIDSFASVEEALSKYPDAQVLEHSTKHPSPLMPDVDPRPDLTHDAGEVWHEDDY